MSEPLFVFLLIMCATFCGAFVGYSFGFDLGWRGSQSIIDGWKKERELFKQLYLSSEGNRQKLAEVGCKILNQECPIFDSYLQDEIDFPDESPVFEKKQ